MTFASYQDYKNTGVEWLGKLPVHWDVLPLKAGFNLKKRPPPINCGVVTAFRDGEVTLRSNRRMDGFTEAFQEIGYQGVEPNDLVIHAMDAFAGAIGVSDSKGKSTPVYSVCEPKQDYYSKYYGLVLRHIALAGYIQSLAKGIRERSTDFRWSDAKNIPVPHPSIEEQKNIIRFLDHEITKINTLVIEQEKLIELLKEKRQVFITNAVTKGLNQTVEMKESGVEWIGLIPKHWTVRRLKYLADIRTGDKDTENSVEDGDYPFFVRSQTIERINSYTYDCEAILTAGDGAGVGKVFHYFNGPFDFHQRVYMLNNFKEVAGKYLFYFFKENFFKVALEGGAKSTVDSLRRPMLTNFSISFPDIDEQKNILSVIEKKAIEFDELILEASRAIQLLQERRSALISAAVTGQIDVRNYQPKEAV